VFQRGGTRLVGVPVGTDGIDVAEAEQAVLKERPKLLLVTSSFQNPTGATLPLRSRVGIAKLAREHKLILVDNNIYGDLRYEGEALPTLRQFDQAGNSLLLGSFSKIAFPGLRVGWIIGSRPLIARLAETKQWCDLHTDQLSQAILLRFAESGRLEAHRKRVRAAGAIRLRAVLAACEQYLPAGARFTRPQGGMSLWVQLPDPLDSADLLPKAQRENVTYLPGRHFTISRPQPGALRLSFGGLSPEQIEAGVQRLGKVFREELQRARSADMFETAPAMV
jgi:2-aminoadipate transaminase